MHNDVVIEFILKLSIFSSFIIYVTCLSIQQFDFMQRLSASGCILWYLLQIM